VMLRGTDLPSLTNLVAVQLSCTDCSAPKPLVVGRSVAVVSAARTNTSVAGAACCRLCWTRKYRSPASSSPPRWRRRPTARSRA
jgi:hypothetical protein